MPDGANADEVDANGDGEVLAVLDLGTDESLVEAGLAREVINRVQKLRKKAGLVASDVVDVFLSPGQHPAGMTGPIMRHAAQWPASGVACRKSRVAHLMPTYALASCRHHDPLLAVLSECHADRAANASADC